MDAKEPGDVCGRTACIQHGEHFGLLLGGELGLPGAVTALGACGADRRPYAGFLFLSAAQAALGDPHYASLHRGLRDYFFADA